MLTEAEIIRDDETIRERTRRAIAAFDTITEASYRGARFRSILATNPEALKAAEALVEFVKS